MAHHLLNTIKATAQWVLDGDTIGAAHRVLGDEGFKGIQEMIESRAKNPDIKKALERASKMYGFAATGEELEEVEPRDPKDLDAIDVEFEAIDSP